MLLQPQCELDLGLAQLHFDHHLVYLIHDYVRARQHTWYEYREEDDLYKKYAKPDGPCLSVYYFKKGSNLNTPTEVFVLLETPDILLNIDLLSKIWTRPF